MEAADAPARKRAKVQGRPVSPVAPYSSSSGAAAGGADEAGTAALPVPVWSPEQAARAEALKKAVAAKLRAAGKAPAAAPAAAAPAAASTKAAPAAAAGGKVAAAAAPEEEASTDGRPVLKWSPARWSAWHDCPSFALIEGSGLVVLKAPLAELYESNFLEANQERHEFFTLDTLANALVPQGNMPALLVDAVPDSGDWFYSPRSLYDEHSLEHAVLPIEAEQKEGVSEELFRFVAPSRAQVGRFLSYAQRAWEDDEIAKVAVASTHGYNRAGVLVVALLVELKKMPLDKALSLFAKSRPPGVYASNCMLALQRRYAPGQPLPVPAAPQWDKHAIECGAAKAHPFTLPPVAGAAPAPGQPALPPKPAPAAGPPSFSSTMPPPAPRPPPQQQQQPQQPQQQQQQQQQSRPHSLAQAEAQAVQPPKPPPGASDKPAPPPPWQRAYSNREQRDYFFNPITKKSCWKIEDCT
jgi:hypothetical protein